MLDLPDRWKMTIGSVWLDLDLRSTKNNIVKGTMQPRVKCFCQQDKLWLAHVKQAVSYLQRVASTFLTAVISKRSSVDINPVSTASLTYWQG